MVDSIRKLLRVLGHDSADVRIDRGIVNIRVGTQLVSVPVVVDNEPATLQQIRARLRTAPRGVRA